jgi:7-carboxy-7-deazaguanine synthase
MTYEYRVSEIFGPTIQGEGAQIGRPTVFVRFGGCDYRCSWCDSLYAVLPEYRPTWQKMDAIGILARVCELAKSTEVLVTLSGGNPALWDMGPLLGEAPHRMTFTMETQGSIVKPWFANLDHLCISPKPPSSNMVTDFSVLSQCLVFAPVDTILKVVVFDEGDFQFAGRVRELAQATHTPMYLQVGNTNPRQDQERDVTQMLDSLSDLSDKVIKAGWYDVRVLPQLHALMWGNKRGV